MKIVLIYPKTSLDKPGVSVGLPMSILYASTLLVKRNYDLILFDSRVEEISNLPYADVYGISAMTGYQIQDGLKYAETARQINPACKIIWGGVHASLLPDQTLEHPLVDSVIIGEGELSILNCVIDISAGRLEKKYFSEFIDLNSLPEPPYQLLNINKYFLNLYQSKQTLSILSARGCPFRCKFCYNSAFNKNKWRPISARLLVDRIKSALAYGAKSVDLVDDNFFVDKQRVIDFCKFLDEEGIHINILTNCRIDFLYRAEDDFLKMIFNAGFKELFIGVESGSQKTLDSIGKGITLEQILSVNRRLRSIGIKPIYSFITGFPDESYAQTKETLRFMVRLLKENPDACVTALKIYTPFPGTELYDRCLQLGMAVPTDLQGWSEFDYNSAYFTKDRRLEKLSYITYFLDHKNMVNFTTSKLVKAFIILYSKYVRSRVKFNWYGFMPEWRIIKYLKNR